MHRKPSRLYVLKCKDLEIENAQSLSFLSSPVVGLSGATFDSDGDAAVEGGEAGFSASMLASRLQDRLVSLFIA
jgi:hypothetical protein